MKWLLIIDFSEAKYSLVTLCSWNNLFFSDGNDRILFYFWYWYFLCSTQFKANLSRWSLRSEWSESSNVWWSLSIVVTVKCMVKVTLREGNYRESLSENWSCEVKIDDLENLSYVKHGRESDIFIPFIVIFATNTY